MKVSRFDIRKPSKIKEIVEQILTFYLPKIEDFDEQKKFIKAAIIVLKKHLVKKNNKDSSLQKLEKKRARLVKKVEKLTELLQNTKNGTPSTNYTLRNEKKRVGAKKSDDQILEIFKNKLAKIESGITKKMNSAKQTKLRMMFDTRPSLKTVIKSSGPKETVKLDAVKFRNFFSKLASINSKNNKNRTTPLLDEYLEELQRVEIKTGLRRY
uniref:CHAD domain-containing protein n=1 Tax=Parastrongyloides trichosuri TaxID=131310 RepID=A0A0N5A0W8_PARTI